MHVLHSYSEEKMLVKIIGFVAEGELTVSCSSNTTTSRCVLILLSHLQTIFLM